MRRARLLRRYGLRVAVDALPSWIGEDCRVSRRGMALTAFSSSNYLRLQVPYPVQESTFDVIKLRR
jgi:hypothetical protein